MKWNLSLPKTRRNKVIALLVVASFVAGGWYWYARGAKTAKRLPSSDSRHPRNIEEVVTSQGKLEAKQYVDVGTQVSGQLRRSTSISAIP